MICLFFYTNQLYGIRVDLVLHDSKPIEIRGLMAEKKIDGNSEVGICLKISTF